MPSFLFGVIIKERSKANKALLYKMDPKGFEPSASALRTNCPYLKSSYTSILPYGIRLYTPGYVIYTLSMPISGTFPNFCWNFVGPRRKRLHILGFMCRLKALSMFASFKYCSIEPARNQHKIWGISLSQDTPPCFAGTAYPNDLSAIFPCLFFHFLLTWL